jgi:hypothetical protein
MPTDNPKISLYVPQQIYDRFKSFQEENKLSMSQAGIVILAEYFGIKETIKEITEGTTVGGVTLAEFEQIKQRLEQLENKVEQFKTTSRPPIKNQSIDKLIENKPNKLSEQQLFEQTTDDVKQEECDRPQAQLELIQEELISISFSLLAKRLKVKNPKSVGNKRSEVYKNNNPNAEAEFYEWSRKKDFDNIGWKPIKEGARVNYIPRDKLSDELLSKLRKWITDNT